MTLGTSAAFVYGILSIVGGVIGYKKAGSKISLISGGASGLLLILSAIASLYYPYWGLLIAAIATAILAIFFAFRLAKTRKIMPAGLMSAVGILALVLIVYELIYFYG